MKVLIADDEAISRRLLQGYLERWGHEVAVAQNGAEAWDLFAAGDFPIVISDWVMPELDGVELIRRIRAHRRPGYVYAVLVTSKSQKEDLVESLRDTFPEACFVVINLVDLMPRSLLRGFSRDGGRRR